VGISCVACALDWWAGWGQGVTNLESLRQQRVEILRKHEVLEIFKPIGRVVQWHLVGACAGKHLDGRKCALQSHPSCPKLRHGVLMGACAWRWVVCTRSAKHDVRCGGGGWDLESFEIGGSTAGGRSQWTWQTGEERPPAHCGSAPPVWRCVVTEVCGYGLLLLPANRDELDQHGFKSHPAHCHSRCQRFRSRGASTRTWP